MDIAGHSVQKLQDPFGVLTGDRYEYLLEVKVEEDDELYTEKGLGLKVIYLVEDSNDKILQYHFYEEGTGKYFDFSLEEDEEKAVLEYCRKNANQS